MDWWVILVILVIAVFTVAMSSIGIQEGASGSTDTFLKVMLAIGLVALVIAIGLGIKKATE